MQDSSITAIQAIQAILAPALGISAVGLLLLGLTNRYSNMVTRIRLLNDEKRGLNRILGEKGELSYTDNTRYMSIVKQTDELLVRTGIIRNAILSLQTAIGLFVLSSTAIALNLFFSADILKAVPLMIFVLGMIMVFVGIFFSGREIHRSYKIILIEVHAEE
ncbi:MAG TPA: DUF2721 domain-containing protein [Bacteroidota bacterium]|nr:DUF2721 domain-containing protein [Bacteroidota bacterium]